MTDNKGNSVCRAYKAFGDSEKNFRCTVRTREEADVEL